MRYRILLLLVVLGLAMGVLFARAHTIHAGTADHLPYYPTAKQEQGGWCWAAALKSIAGYYGQWHSQCDIVKITWGPICAGWMFGYPDSRVTDTLLTYNFNSDLTGVISFNAIVSEISTHRRPIYIRRKLDPEPWWQHAMVLTGYNTVWEEQLVERMDPGGGYFDMHTYDWFVDGGDGWKWKATVYHIQRW